MTAAPLVVRQFAQTVQIVGSKKGDAILERKAFAGDNLKGDIIQLLIVR